MNQSPESLTHDPHHPNLISSMKIKSIPSAWILSFALAAAFSVDTGHCASGPLVDLDASKLAEGPLPSWTNTGSLKGSFKNDGALPQVKVIDGVKAVAFGGAEHLLADFTAPDSITGDKPFSCVVRAYSTDIRGERALIAWSTRPGNCLELEWSDAPGWGAIGTFSDAQMGWTKGAPPTGKWHHLIYTYTGGKDGTLQAWCDAELRAEKKGTVATKPGKPFVLGACQAENGPDKVTYEHSIVGAIASVQVHDHALGAMEVWKASGMDTPYPVAPGRDAVLDGITTTLKWEPVTPGAASYDVYLGTDKAALEAASNSLPAGTAADWSKVYKGSQPAAKTGFGPLALKLGTTYYWRIDQRGGQGTLKRGATATFSTDSGMATNPKPDTGGFFVDGGKKMELAWKPGKYAVKQNIHFGKTAAEVLASNKPIAADLPAGTTSIAFPVKQPAVGDTYFWRVESVNGNNIPTTKGEVWCVRIINKKLRIYLLGGQSNASGCASCIGLPPELLGPQKSVIAFARGSIQVKEYGWDWLKDGLGDGFGDRGKGAFGPELTFGVNMAKAKPGEVLGILKCAWGATDLGVQWRPPGAGGETGPLYKRFIEAVHQGIAALDPAFEPEIAGMIWMQGESDASNKQMTADYVKNLSAFIKDIRVEAKRPDMPFVLAQISKAPAWGPDLGDALRAAQLEVVKTVPKTATFPTDDYKLCDPWHYDTEGMISLGQRFAKAMLDLEKK